MVDSVKELLNILSEVESDVNAAAFKKADWCFSRNQYQQMAEQLKTKRAKEKCTLEEGNKLVQQRLDGLNNAKERSSYLKHQIEELNVELNAVKDRTADVTLQNEEAQKKITELTTASEEMYRNLILAEIKEALVANFRLKIARFHFT